MRVKIAKKSRRCAKNKAGRPIWPSCFEKAHGRCDGAAARAGKMRLCTLMHKIFIFVFGIVPLAVVAGKTLRGDDSARWGSAGMRWHGARHGVMLYASGEVRRDVVFVGRGPARVTRGARCCAAELRGRFSYSSLRRHGNRRVWPALCLAFCCRFCYSSPRMALKCVSVVGRYAWRSAAAFGIPRCGWPCKGASVAGRYAWRFAAAFVTPHHGWP